MAPASSILYLIHRARLPNRRINLDRTYRWLKFLADALPDCAFMAPWTAYCEALDEDTYRERGMRDGLAFVSSMSGRVAGIVCGPEISDGCYKDIGNLATFGFPSIDLTAWGLAEPPAVLAPNVATVLRATVARAVAVHDSSLWRVCLDARATREEAAS